MLISISVIGFMIPLYLIMNSICKFLDNSNNNINEINTNLNLILKQNIPESLANLNNTNNALSALINENIPELIKEVTDLTHDFNITNKNINNLLIGHVPEILKEVKNLTRDFNKTNKNVNEIVETIEFKPLRRGTTTLIKNILCLNKNKSV